MTYALLISRRENGAWPVYLVPEDPIRQEGAKVHEPGKLVGKVVSWAELDALAAKYNAPSRPIGDDDDLDQMEEVLGPQPE